MPGANTHFLYESDTVAKNICWSVMDFVMLGQLGQKWFGQNGGSQMDNISIECLMWLMCFPVSLSTCSPCVPLSVSRTFPTSWSFILFYLCSVHIYSTYIIIYIYTLLTLFMSSTSLKLLASILSFIYHPSVFTFLIFYSRIEYS